MYVIFTCLHFIQYIPVHYDTAMAAAVRIRSGLGLYFTPPPLGLKLMSSQSLHQVVEAAAPDHPLFLPPSSRVTGLSHQSRTTF